MIFLLQKQFFEKIITEGGRELIVLNPFLDSLCNSAFKNIGLAPGVQKTCFQHPQDAVVVESPASYLYFYSFLNRRTGYLNATNETSNVRTITVSEP